MAQKQPYSSGQFLPDFHNNQTLSIPVQGIPDSCGDLMLPDIPEDFYFRIPTQNVHMDYYQ